jgi:hypothetical protein
MSEGASEASKSSEVQKLDVRVRAMLSKHGGWNERARRDVVLLLHSVGLPGDAAAQIVARAMRSAAEGTQSPESDSPQDEQTAGASVPLPSAIPPRPTNAEVRRPAKPSPTSPADSVIFDAAATAEQHDPGNEALRRALLIFGGLAVTMVVIGLVGLVILSVKPNRKPVPPPAPLAGPKVLPDVLTARKPAPAAPAPSVPVDLGDPSGALRLIASSIDEVALDADVAINTFAAGYAAAGRLWPRFTPDQLTACVNSCVDLVHRVKSDPAASARVVAMLEADIVPTGSAGVRAEQILPAVWASGIAARLRREGDFPATLLDQLRSLGGADSSSSADSGIESFRAGAIEEAATLARGMAARCDPASVWKAWCEAVDAAASSDAERAARVKISALERLLVAGPEPAPEGFAASVAQFVVSIPWREEDASRRAMLRWFGSPEIGINDLRAVTLAITRLSSAAADPTMVLSANASAADRDGLRDRYAALWAIGGGTDARIGVVSEFRQAAGELLREVPRTPARVDVFAYAVAAMRLNSAAEMIRAGQHDTAGIVIKGAKSGLSDAINPAQAAEPDEAESERWIVALAQAEQNQAKRLAVLSQARADVFNGAAAQVLMREALRGSAAPLRAAARNAVQRAVGSSNIAEAALEELPGMPLTSDNAELISIVASVEDLPPIRDASWRLAARRALVARMLFLLSRDEETLAIERLITLAAETYAQRGATARAADPQTATPSLPSSVSDLCDLWRDRASAASGSTRLPVSAIESRRSGMRELAEGQLQRCAADQAAMVEYLARVVDAEAPGQSGAIEALVSAYTMVQRQAGTIFDQMLASELTMLALWEIRLAGGST